MHVPHLPSPHLNRPRNRQFVRALGCLLCCALAPAVRAQDDAAPSAKAPIGIQDNSWAGFAVGSSKAARVTREVFGREGKLESTTIQDVTITLREVKNDRFVLHEEATLEVAGKRLPTTTRTIERGIYNEMIGQSVTIKTLREGKVTICQREYATQIHEIIVADGSSKRVSTVHYSPTLRPTIVRRDTTSTDPTGKETSWTNVEVLAMDMPQRVMEEIRPCAHLRTVHVQDDITTITLEVSCERVPGHLVSHSAKRVNAAGQLIERSTLELLGYDVAAKQ